MSKYFNKLSMKTFTKEMFVFPFIHSSIRSFIHSSIHPFWQLLTIDILMLVRDYYCTNESVLRIDNLFQQTLFRSKCLTSTS